MTDKKTIAKYAAIIVELQNALDNFSRDGVSFNAISMFQHNSGTLSGSGFYAEFKVTPFIMGTLRHLILLEFKKALEEAIQNIRKELETTT